MQEWERWRNRQLVETGSQKALDTMLLSGDFVWKERSAWLRDGWKVGEDKGWVRGSGSSS